MHVRVHTKRCGNLEYQKETSVSNVREIGEEMAAQIDNKSVSLSIFSQYYETER